MPHSLNHHTLNVGFDPKERRFLHNLDKRFNKISVIVLIILFLGILGGLSIAYWINHNKQLDTTNVTDKNLTDSPSPAPQIVLNQITIVLTPTGFVPNTVVIKPGIQIKFWNQSGTKASINSDTANDTLLNLGEFDNNQSLMVTINQPGSYNYQNTVNQKGVIKIQP